MSILQQKDYQRRIFAEGIPATMFGVADLEKEYSRLLEKGVEFTLKPTKAGEVTIAVLMIHVATLFRLYKIV